MTLMTKWGVLLFALLGATGALAQAVPVTGEATFYDPTGMPIMAQTPITGELDFEASTASFSPFMFFGFQFVTTSVELLGEGTHTRPADGGLTGSETITVSVGPGQLGAYFVFDWTINTLPTFMVWDINSHPTGTSYTTTDSDGDGIPGHAFVTDPFPGFTVAFDLLEGEPPPDIEVSIDAGGATTRECAEHGGSTVILNADITLIGSAELGTVDWTIDGAPAGSGSSIYPFLSRGTHNIGVNATILSGASDTDSASITVRDTTPPEIHLAFLDEGGQAVTSIGTGTHVKASIEATDICDPAPATEGSATPVFEVTDGDVIKIQSGKIKELPTTAIELSGTATDASGNRRSGMTVLTIH
jgi:hypothetical protein